MVTITAATSVSVHDVREKKTEVNEERCLINATVGIKIETLPSRDNHQYEIQSAGESRK